MITLKEKLKAIKGSVDKWDKISKGEIKDMGMNNCPLCSLYVVRVRGFYSCGECPIMAKTGRRQCGGTPYERYKTEETRVSSLCYGSPPEKFLAAATFRDWLRDLYIEVNEKELKKLREEK